MFVSLAVTPVSYCIDLFIFGNYPLTFLNPLAGCSQVITIQITEILALSLPPKVNQKVRKIQPSIMC